jgi:molybdopterin/thiamine biosynthesis adenylyltransferase
MCENRPSLKDFTWLESETSLTLTRDAGVEIRLVQPEPQLLSLLRLLDGARTVPGIVSRLQETWSDVRTEDVLDALTELDRVQALEDAGATTTLDSEQRERFTSNLEFFGTFATLGRSRYSFQSALCDATVLVLGVGGIGSIVLAGLAGLGVGCAIIADHDRVEVKNLARQFLYSDSDVGHYKVERAAARARALHADMTIRARPMRIHGVGDVNDLLDRVDLVICTIDEPEAVRSWVNQACVAARIPFVVGGIWAQRAQYMSVNPGVSGCLECLDRADSDDIGAVVRPATAINRGIGPSTSILGGLMAMEALRYLTDFARPVAAGRMWIVDAVSGRLDVAGEWPRIDACNVCSTLPLTGPRRTTDARPRGVPNVR